MQIGLNIPMPKNYKRKENDAYITPRWCVVQMINEVLPVIGGVGICAQPGLRILDPGSGKGVFGQCLRQNLHASTHIVGVELDEARHGKGYFSDYNRSFKGDFLACNQELLGGWFDYSAGNPPYFIAVEFIKHSITMAEWTIMFLRQGFLSSDGRAEWFGIEHPPHSVHMLPNRPKFEGPGADKSDYCWVVWNCEPWVSETKLYWLKSIPLIDRQR